MKKIITGIFLITLTGLAYQYQQIRPEQTNRNENSLLFEAVRLSKHPIITPNLHPILQEEGIEYGYTNINGPSLIRVPDWVENRLGNYYLYFAHHKGRFIRMAYADSLVGKWTMYEGEIMNLKESGLVQTATKGGTNFQDLLKYTSISEAIAIANVGIAAQKAWKERNKQKIKTSSPKTPHVASPEVVIDESNKKIRLYFHGVVEGAIQMSKAALSEDGLHFKTLPEVISLPYLRVFHFQDAYYGIAMPGILYRSKDGSTNFEARKKWVFPTNVRHSGLYLKNEELYIFYSQVGDNPERILYTKMDLSHPNWNNWLVEPSQEVLRPSLEWEGKNQPLTPSIRGEMGNLVHQLRDPDVFEDIDGQLYLLYTGGGEQNIGIARLETINQ